MGALRKSLYGGKWTFGQLLRDRNQTLTAMAVISLSFFILEIFLLVSLNLQNLIQQWGGQLRLIVYLKDSLSQEQISNIEKKLRQTIDYQELGYISKEQAWKEFQRDFKIDDLLTEIDHNFLPTTFIIKLKAPPSTEREIKETSLKLQKIKGVTEVEYGGLGTEWARKVLPIYRSVILTLGIVLSLAILAITTSTFRSSLQSWHLKIDILQKSGISPWLIKTPVILSGLIQGALSACLSLGILFILYKTYLSYFFYWEKTSYQLLGSIPISFLPFDMSCGLIAGGMLVGSWSSWLFLRKK
jgi:cell division transport system permease protein